MQANFATPRIVLYRPDIPQNVGAIARLCACLGLGLGIVGPTAFKLSATGIRRAGMDYLALVELRRFADWDDFIGSGEFTPSVETPTDARPITTYPHRGVNKGENGNAGRLLLFSTKATQSAFDFRFSARDILLFGRESAGVPESIARQCTNRLRLPMRPAARSLNLAQSVAVAAYQVLNDLQQLPES